MIRASRSSVCSKVQLSRLAFCCISSAEVATPPALAALPGPNATPASRNADTASGVAGMFAPSTTAMTPLRIRVAASAPVSSFWVAHGSATSHGTSQMLPSVTNCASGCCCVYSLTRPRALSLISLSSSRSSPDLSTT